MNKKKCMDIKINLLVFIITGFITSLIINKFVYMKLNEYYSKKKIDINYYDLKNIKIYNQNDLTKEEVFQIIEKLLTIKTID